MKVKRMGITEILRRIGLFSANKIKSSESFSKHPTQLIIAAHNCRMYWNNLLDTRRLQLERVKSTLKKVCGVI